MRRLGALPLMYQPGERWLYNTSCDLMGVLVGRLAGKAFSGFWDERLFGNQRLDSTNQRLDLVETTLLDLAEQNRFIVRYTKALSELYRHGGRSVLPPDLLAKELAHQHGRLTLAGAAAGR